jgi:nucleotide-binding universal stress UspA family protein
MLRSILVPLDGSAFSQRALPWACMLAKRHGAELRLVAVDEPLMLALPFADVPGFDASVADSHREALEQALRDAAARVCDDVGTQPTLALLGGSVAEAIAGEAERENVDLIVMTTHGRGGFARAWLGSVADALVRQASVPVLLVHAGSDAVEGAGTDDAPLPAAQRPSLRRVLIPLDGSALAEEVVATAMAVGLPGETTFVLLRVVIIQRTSLPVDQTFWTPQEREAMRRDLEEAETYLNGVAEHLRTAGFDAEVVATLAHDAARAILREAEAREVDLVAIATNARRGVPRLVLGSVTDKVVRGATRPTLVMRPPGTTG